MNFFTELQSNDSQAPLFTMHSSICWVLMLNEMFTQQRAHEPPRLGDDKIRRVGVIEFLKKASKIEM